MSPTPYHRPGLGDPDRERPNAAAMVAAWARRLACRLDEPSGPDPVSAAFDLLALTAALERVRPELLPSAEPGTLLARARARLEQIAAEELSQAGERVRPGAWLAAGRDLQEHRGEPEERALPATQLLVQRDEADLAAWSLRRLGFFSEAREEGLELCAAWLEEHVDLFRPAAAHVRAVAGGLRPDLPAVDFDLAWTADKYVLLLDDLEKEEQERWLSEPPPPLPADLLAAARDRLARPHLIGEHWLTPVVAPAAVPMSSGATALRALRWRAADDRHRASLILPGPFDALTWDAVVRLNLFDGDEPARDLAGQPLSLAGVAGQVDIEGWAVFRVADLRLAQEAGREPVLRVGPAAALWEREADESPSAPAT